MSMEFVAFDGNGNLFDSVDPYASHREGDGCYLVEQESGNVYEVFVPEGGHYEIREREDHR